MQPISAPTLETINTMRDHKVNSMAGKLFLYNDTVYTKHKCKPNLIEQQLKTTRELNHNRDIIELVRIIVVEISLIFMKIDFLIPSESSFYGLRHCYSGLNEP